jgi:hypothetical protein
LCDALRLTVTVCHYPTGCSKWNPIEHRLFGPISLNGAGYPLRTWDTMLVFLLGTTTATGLQVQAVRLNGVYDTGAGGLRSTNFTNLIDWVRGYVLTRRAERTC